MKSTRRSKRPSPANLLHAISLEQLMDAILCLKKGKAPGIDLVHTEFLCHMGLRALDWLLPGRPLHPRCLLAR